MRGEDVLLRVLGDTDCETLGTGVLAQPVNALTSLSFVAVAAWIAWRAVGAGADRARSLVYAVCLGGIGVGSVLFHGPQPVGARLVHDLPILLTVLFIVVQDLRVLGRLRDDRAVFGLAAVAATVATALSADLGAALTGVAILTVALLEAVVVRRRARLLDGRRHVRAHVVIIGLVSVGVASWALGRTGSPVCDPNGPVQLHGLWHVISSLVLGMWWWLTMWLPSRPAADAPAGRPIGADHGMDR